MLSSLLITLQPWPIKFLIDGVLVDSRLDLGPLGTVVSETDSEKLRVASGLAAAYLLITVVGVLLNAASFYAIARTALLDDPQPALASRAATCARSRCAFTPTSPSATPSGGRSTTPAASRK